MSRVIDETLRLINISPFVFRRVLSDVQLNAFVALRDTLQLKSVPVGLPLRPGTHVIKLSTIFLEEDTKRYDLVVERMRVFYLKRVLLPNPLEAVANSTTVVGFRGAEPHRRCRPHPPVGGRGTTERRRRVSTSSLPPTPLPGLYPPGLYDGSKTLLHSFGVVSSSAIIPGEIRNHLKPKDLLDFVALERSSPSLLRAIVYCQSGLTNGFTRSLTKGLQGAIEATAALATNCINPKSIINHDFLVIVLVVGGVEQFFLAEKCGPGEECGINITLVRSLGEYTNAKLLNFDCEDTPLELHELMRILENHDPQYSHHDKNCWEYAMNTTRKLLMECHRRSGKAQFCERAEVVGGEIAVAQAQGMSS
ncbi:hypothetical protein SELMODRAFT_445083 [Selaginella moellendorffii]|uniref:Uncharacterized protein n=1 Tax=Selaginella moellendorffii TaxID=88036 RepID=D8SFF4_SELML|nr:hypothetical protein SELMODRAFT_445083 [Selaginella moellendorffii]